MLRPWMTVAVFGLVLAGCAQAPPPAPDMRDADAKAIRDNEEAWAKDWAAKDADKIASHYADDASLLMPDSPILTGKAAIAGGLKDLLKDPNLSLAFSPSKVEASKGSDIAYTQGTYTLTMTDPKSKKTVTEKGKYVTVYKKQADGTWKAIEDINNADAPAMPEKK